MGATRSVTVEVAVIGAGPGGLAAAAMVKQAGFQPVVFERAADVASSWRGHYDRLHLHTVRWMSNLPGLPFPRSEGKWVSRGGVVSHMETYVAHFGLDVRTGVDVTRIDAAPGGWRLETSQGPVHAWAVVVATGYNRVPIEPSWPGRDTFQGEFVRAADYKNPTPYRGKNVLVVGPGNSGAEIATDLAEGGARTVWLSYRTPPNIISRDRPLPPPVLGVVMERLRVGPRLGDWIAATIQRRTIGDMTRYGFPPAPRSIGTQMVRDEVIPIIDLGLVKQVKAGRVTPVPETKSLEGHEVVLADGQRLDADVVVCCIGYRPGLEPLVGHLGLVGPKKGHPIVYGGDTARTRPDCISSVCAP
ncbi:monooxygenase [Phytohabitans flavus]|uniref:Monooxygenase n=1 Tax=Phytohabitans flavus TaxID=1076124 RepID=A0A6F8XLY5_9ACTN|nr:NAD(P)/FAD-dependent oxidoreductase [Phytohabitans flavus]BCB74808.1 monooxygenase [Phytohabitans flavus]